MSADDLPPQGPDVLAIQGSSAISLAPAEDTLRSIYILPLLLVKGSLIDFETTGVPGSGNSEVVTLGYVQGGQATIVQRKSQQKEPYYNVIKPIMTRLPRPLYSYNNAFEKEVIRLELGIQAQESEFVDLFTPWKAKAEAHSMKWPSLDDLISEPEDYFHMMKVSGRYVPNLWAQYLAKPSEDWALKRIMNHCLSDVLREAMLLLRYPEYFSQGK